MQAVRGGENVAIGKAVDVFPVLGRKLEQAAGTMSGGEQQMLAMARAWIREPRIILVDEASLGLAPRVVESIFDFLAQLATGGTSLVVVDQFVARALDLADRAHVMTRGELSFSGSAAELRDRDVFRDYVSGDPGNAPEVGVG
jgi:branched-chain amino acid transport system ATP-binding protein